MKKISGRPPNGSVEFQNLVGIVGLFTISLSLWFYTAGTAKISDFPPNAYFYLSSLPFGYWIGLTSTFALFAARRLVKDRPRTLLEISTLWLLCLYLYGLTSFVYPNAWFFDTYQHEGNALAMLSSGGWYNGAVWYVYQFPGAYTFFAQLTAVAAINPFQLMRYYPAGLSLVLAFLLYGTVSSYSARYAFVASAFIMGGFWFQLHLSPQSLELIPYIGLLFLLIKTVEDAPNRRRWMAVSILITPILVLDHPETPLVLSLGLTGFFVLQALFSRERIKTIRLSLTTIGPLFVVLTIVIFVWWTVVASGALGVVMSIVNGAIASGIGGLTHRPQNIPASPAPSYETTILLQEAAAALVWLIGLSVLVFIRRFHFRDYLFGGLFLAAVATIPVALFGNADVLQRSYLFALFPCGFLLASLLERGNVLRFRGRFLTGFLGKGLIVMIICFSVVMPVSRHGFDSFTCPSQSSLAASNVSAALTNNHSILFLHPGWYGWRYYAPLNGYEGAVVLESNNISGTPGGFIKINTQSEFNLTYSRADSTAGYILIPDFLDNAYVLRFGSNATSYIDQKIAYENMASTNFNLVYSTGTDRLYENLKLG